MRATGERRTTRRMVSILGMIGLVAAMLAAGPGAAATARRSVTLQVRPVVVGWADGCGIFGVDLELLSFRGDLVGTARACADELIDPGDGPGTWRPIYSGTVYLELVGGTVSGAVRWDQQNWVPDGANPEIIERFLADLTVGTGAYTNMTGSISGGGIVQWDGDDPVDDTMWTITLRSA